VKNNIYSVGNRY